MPARIFDTAGTAAAIRAEVEAGAAALRGAGVVPVLAAVMGGQDPASVSYVRAIRRAAERTGIQLRQVTLDPAAGDAGLRRTIAGLNEDPGVHGVIVLFPLPAPFTQRAVAETLDPRKDVDGITPANLGRLALNEPAMVASTPLGGMELLRRHGIDVRGLDATVVGRGAVVGRPLALLLINAHATVTVCHTATRDLAAACRRADLLCAATGRPGLITAEMIKPGAIVLDFGTSPGPDGRLVGDVDFAAAQAVASWITPESGGTGPVTTAVLLRNTLEAARAQAG
jgi:methylenetetrahydrofolate dehydrogenase (NADP+)/methenyltetrahydrofolate cyclohydrolase